MSLQVNAQILVSTFAEESHQLIKLGEAVGAVLQACIASNKPLSSVQITTQGKTVDFAPSRGVIVEQQALMLVVQLLSAVLQLTHRLVFFKPGDCMKSSTGYLSSSVLVGLLKHEGCYPNLINILSLSKEAGIMVLQQVFKNIEDKCVLLENLTCELTL